MSEMKEDVLFDELTDEDMEQVSGGNSMTPDQTAGPAEDNIQRQETGEERRSSGEYESRIPNRPRPRA